ncbi:hypothetical protein [Mucilaginibacter lacusdianchii]|uniref:hypothetical protein n=1 Tax=Mucilaginibacter lacusdianchii TaxID=2684211 RepID=UPI00131C0ADF|nr:hypothetical protein [Mucilaginibacter sp. JXJ CY 39]
MKKFKFLVIGFLAALSLYSAETNAAPVTKLEPQQRVIVRTGPRHPVRRRVVRRRYVRRNYGRPGYYARPGFRRGPAVRHYNHRAYRHHRVYRRY